MAKDEIVQENGEGPILNSEKKDAPAKEAKPADNKPSEKVEIEKDALDALLARLDRVEAAADKKQLARFDAANRESMGKNVRLRTYKGKLISKWLTVKDVVEQEPGTGRWIEDQLIKLFFADGETEEVQLRSYVKAYVYIQAKVARESKDPATGDIVYTVEVTEKGPYEGQTFEVTPEYIN